jgi:hypothetical protein
LLRLQRFQLTLQALIPRFFAFNLSLKSCMLLACN